jgi:protein-tyrosine phosphatase
MIETVTHLPFPVRRIMFVCHGNICRSPMAEMVMAELLRKVGRDDVTTASAATSTEEIGNGVHPGTVRLLNRHSIPMRRHEAVQLTRRDAERYDLFIGMDAANLRNMRRILGNDAEGRIFNLLDFSDKPRDISDPWYTGDFETTFSDIMEGCQALLTVICK